MRRAIGRGWMFCADVPEQNVSTKRHKKLKADNLVDKLPDAWGFIIREIIENIPLSSAPSERPKVGCLGDEPRRGGQVEECQFRLAKR